MASTYVDGTFSVPNYAHRLRLTVTEVMPQNVAANTTTVSWVLQVTKMTNYGGNSTNANPWAVNIGGVGYSGTFTYNLSGQPIGYTITIASGTTTIAHNADGTKSISISSSANTTVLGNASNSGTFTLTTIPRASNPTFSPNPVEAGATLSIATNRASTSFTHDLTYSIGSATGTIATGVGASTTWVVPLALLNQLPASTTGALTITTVTKSGATTIGTRSATVTIAAPASVVPVVGDVLFEEATTSPDVDAIVGALVKTISTLAVALDGAVGAYGSTILSSRIDLLAPDGVTTLWSATGSGDSAAGVTAPIPQSGNLLLRGTVTDSRNRTGTKTVTVPVMNYTPPTIASFTAARSTSGGVLDPDGTSIRVDVESAVQSLVVGTQKNDLKYRLRIRQRGSTTPWASVTPAASSAGVGAVGFTDDIVVGGYSASFGWEVRFELEDNLGQVSAYEVQVGTAGVQFFLSGTSDMTGFGKYPEQYEVGKALSIDARERIYHRSGKRILDVDDLSDIGDELSDIGDELAALSAGYRLVQVVRFTAGGTFAKASYPGVRAVRVRAVGGGGGGGGAAPSPTSGTQSFGQGGGGGGYAESFITDIASLPTSVAVTVGAGGTGAPPGGSLGGAGGASSFGVLVAAGGGGGGSTKPASQYGAYVPPGSGGVGTAGDFRVSGGGGSSGAGDHFGLAMGGTGGPSLLGGGGVGGATGAGGGNMNGAGGGNYGGGGGGGMANAGNTGGASGGNGAPGIVIVEVYA